MWFLGIYAIIVKFIDFLDEKNNSFDNVTDYLKLDLIFL